MNAASPIFCIGRFLPGSHLAERRTEAARYVDLIFS